MSTEDGQGSTESIFLEDGFLDYLNKVIEFVLNYLALHCCMIQLSL